MSVVVIVFSMLSVVDNWFDGSDSVS